MIHVYFLQLHLACFLECLEFTVTLRSQLVRSQFLENLAPQCVLFQHVLRKLRHNCLDALKYKEPFGQTYCTTIQTKQTSNDLQTGANSALPTMKMP